MNDANWPDKVFALTLFTEDLGASRAFYAKFLDAASIHEDVDSVVFRAGSTLINLLRFEAVPELIEPLQMGPGGRCAVYTLTVPDVDRACARLAKQGLHPASGPVDRPWGPRTANFSDPSGHVWELSSSSA
ncbi:MAG: VOC family protein [Maritimibacter sp.]|nr:VOC family protein [Maritimibacter sp.]